MNKLTAPIELPTISSGDHEPGESKACVMEYVALLAGETWTAEPACTHLMLAVAAQVINDNLPDSDRHLLVPLISRLLGTDAPAIKNAKDSIDSLAPEEREELQREFDRAEEEGRFIMRGGPNSD